MKNSKQKKKGPNEHSILEDIYKSTNPEDLPWSMEHLPAPLAALVDRGTVRPCKTIDIGCGIGRYAILLVEQGFDVVGIDSAPSAIS